MKLNDQSESSTKIKSYQMGGPREIHLKRESVVSPGTKIFGSLCLKGVSFLIVLLLSSRVQCNPPELSGALLPQKAMGLSPATGSTDFPNW